MTPFAPREVGTRLKVHLDRFPRTIEAPDAGILGGDDLHVDSEGLRPRSFMQKERNKKRKAKLALALMCLVCLAFAGGYHTGRATSTNWNSEKAAFLMRVERVIESSHRIKWATDGALLEVTLPEPSFDTTETM